MPWLDGIAAAKRNKILAFTTSTWRAESISGIRVGRAMSQQLVMASWLLDIMAEVLESLTDIYYLEVYELLRATFRKIQLHANPLPFFSILQ